MSSFEVKNIVPINFLGFDISITNSSLFMLIVVGIIGIVFFLGTSDKGLIPNKLQAATENAFYFVGNIVKTSISKKSVEFFPYVIALFMFILFGNVIGLLPFSFSFTSQIIVTFGMALIVFLLSLVLGICAQGIKYFKRFCPAGIPEYLIPFFIVIELMSFLFRPISLGIRLFANMLAGHVMIEVIASFAASIAGILALSYFAAIPIIINVLLNAFKLLVCGLQAYVFVVLSCIYLSESIETPEH
ncbi:MAG: F0F1 ATP synthase subunit A [Holosporales bacterium]|jgi:F-type H+-transporting ATPase subunit a|nr:F0F1 ATP synthase subunit A [Holosporales bacterium]